MPVEPAQVARNLDQAQMRLRCDAGNLVDRDDCGALSGTACVRVLTSRQKSLEPSQGHHR
jgi:hypothetical protein